MIKVPLRSERTGRFEEDLLAIVGGADRAASGLWRNVAGAVGIGSAVTLASLGFGLLTTRSEKVRSASVPVSIAPVPQAAPAANMLPAGKVPPLPISMVAPVRDPAGSAGPTVLSSTQASSLVRHIPTRHHIEGGDRAGLAMTGRGKSPFAGRNPLATRLAQTTGDTGNTGAAENNAPAEHERSDHVSSSKQAVIATRDALRDLRLR